MGVGAYLSLVFTNLRENVAAVVALYIITYLIIL